MFARSYVNIPPPPPPLKTINFSFSFCPSTAFLLSLHRSEPTVQPLLPSRGAHELLQPGHDVNSQRLTDARKAGRRSLDTGQGFESGFAILLASRVLQHFTYSQFNVIKCILEKQIMEQYFEGEIDKIPDSRPFDEKCVIKKLPETFTHAIRYNITIIMETFKG